MKKIYSLITLLIHFTIMNATVTVTHNGVALSGSPYTTLSAAITAINGLTITGPVIADVTAGHTETLTAPIVLTATGTSANKIIIQKSGAGANPIITSYTGTIAGTTTSTAIDGIFIISGSDYVTIDGINLIDKSTNTTAITQMEVGYGLYKTSVTNGCQNDTIRNCTVTLGSVNTISNTCIGSFNSLWTATTTALTITAASGSNSYNGFISNTTIGGGHGINLGGFSDATLVLSDLNNYIYNNNISNYTCATTLATNSASYGILFGGNNGICSNNTISSNPTSKSLGHIGGVYYTSIAGSCNISNNTISVYGGSSTSLIYGVRIQGGLAGSTIDINNNKIQNCTYTTLTTTGGFFGIQVTPVGTGTTIGTLNINNNKFSGNAIGGSLTTSGTTYMIAVNGGSITNLNILNDTITTTSSISTNTASSAAYSLILNSATVTNANINNNILTNNSYGTATGSCSGIVYGINNTGTVTNTYIKNNLIDGLSRTGTSGSTSAAFSGIYSTGGSSICYIKNNIIKNLAYNGAGVGTLTYGIFAGVSADLQIDSNSIDSIRNYKTVGTTAMYGIYNASAATNEKYRNNTIRNIISAGTNGQSIIGMYFSTGPGTREISNNTISNFSCLGPIIGINSLLSTPIIKNNLIYSLSTTGAIATSQVSGIVNGSVSSGNAEIYNNIISDFTANNSISPNAIIGINATAIANNYINHNTIYFGGNGAPVTSSSTTNFGGSGILYGTITGEIKNNIINLKGNPLGSGGFVALRRNAVGTVSTAPSGLNASNNILWVSPNAYNWIIGEGLDSNLINAVSTSGVTDYPLKNRVLDNLFNTACSPFKLSTYGTALCAGSAQEDDLTMISGGSYTYAPVNPSSAESGAATPTNSILTDFLGATRSSPSDIGAIEFIGTSIDASGPSISYTNIPNLNCVGASGPTISVNITDASGVNTTPGTAPRIYYKFATDANLMPNKSSNNISSNTGWKYVETTSTSSPYTFNLDYSILNSTPVVGDNIQYFFVAQDNAPVTNVSSDAGTVAPSSVCLSSVDLFYASGLTGITSSKSFAISPSNKSTSASLINVCLGNIDTLVTTITQPGTSKLGSGTAASATFTPYFSSTTGLARKIQYIYTAAELNAAGFKKGNITSIGFYLGAVPTAVSLPNLSISMGSTSASVGTTSFIPTGLTQVFTTASYSPIVGLNTHTFGTTTPYYWDGTSNVVVQVCHGVVTTASAITALYSSTLPTGTTVYSTVNTGCTTTTGTTAAGRPNTNFTGEKDVSAGMSYTWADDASSVGANNDTIIVYPMFGAGAVMSMKYYVTATDPSSCSILDTITLNRNLSTPSIVSSTLSPPAPCFGDSVSVAISVIDGCPPYFYSYQFAPSSGSPYSVLLSSTGKFLTSVSGVLTVTVTDNASNTVSLPFTSVSINAQPTAENETRCGVGTVNLTASGAPGNKLLWYRNGVYLDSGVSITSPVLTAMDSFTVTDNTVSTVITGRTAATSPGSATTLTNYTMYFTVTKTTKLNSVDVCSGTGSSITIQLYNQAGTTSLQSTGAVATSVGVKNTIPLNWILTPGTYRLAETAMTGTFFREGGTGLSYPYPLGSSGSITGYTASTLTAAPVTNSTTTYYYFYNWNIDEYCSSPSTKVIATLTTPPSISIPVSPNDTICIGSSTTLSVSSSNSGYTYDWNNGLATGSSINVSPTADIIYKVLATDNSGGANNGCSTQDSIKITVSAMPVALGLTQGVSSPDCYTRIDSLNVTGGTISVAKSGNPVPTKGTTIGGTNGNVYRTGAGATLPVRTQVIYTATELLSMGLKANDIITTIGFSVVSVTATPTIVDSLVIGTKLVSYTSFPSTTFETGIVPQFSSKPFTLSLGLNNHTLASPITWDGVSSLVVESRVAKAVATTTTIDGVAAMTSSALTSTAAGATTGTLSTFRPWATIGALNITDVAINWTPTTSLYTNPSATNAYTGTNLKKVYTKSTATTTYYATATNGFCVLIDSITDSVKSATNSAYLPTATVTGASSSCPDPSGWTYYENPSNPSQLIFGINKGSSGMTGETITIEVLGSNPASTGSSGANQEHGSFFMKRGWDVTGTVPTGSVTVRFFYDPNDSLDACTARDADSAAKKTTNPNSLMVKTPFEWFKSSGMPYNSTWRASVVGNKFPSSHVKLTPSAWGTLNGLSYVDFTNITSFSGGSGGAGYGAPGSGGGASLPVTWVDFDVIALESGNKLTWSTGSEKNADYFQVEYSYDAINFNTISDRIKAVGNSTVLNTYSAKHADFSNYIYYRIKQIDIDGRSDYSHTKVLKRTSLTSFNVSVFPIPIEKDNILNVKISSVDKSHLEFKLTDLTGKVIKSKSFYPTTEAVSESIDMSNMAPGIYFIEVKNAQGKKLVKIVK